MKKQLTISLLSITAILFAALLPLNFVKLFASDNSFAPSPVASLVVSPYEEIINVNPGEVTKLSFELRNTQQVPILVDVSYEDFKESAINSGTPEYFLPSEDIPSFYPSSWFSNSNVIEIPANSFLKEVVSLKVPQNATPGGHYGGIIFEPVSDTSISPSKSTGLAISGKIAIPTLITVSGDIKNVLAVSAFSPVSNIYSVFSWLNGGITCLFTTDCKTNLLLTFNNTGNVHEAPRGNIEIRGWDGGKVVVPVNSTGSYVLASSKRQFPIEFSLSSLSGIKMGVYSATFSGVYGTSSLPISSQTSFFVINWSYIITLLIFIALVIGIYTFQRAKKNKKIG